MSSSEASPSTGASFPDIDLPAETLNRLIAFCARRPFPGLQEIKLDLKARYDYYFCRLTARPRLTRDLAHALNAIDHFTRDGTLDLHPCWAQNICAVLYLLLLDCENANGPPATLAAIDKAFVAAVRYFLDFAAPQIDALCDYLLDVRVALRRLLSQDSRIVLLELPIGNSLPVQVLESLLTPLAPVVRVCAVLNRADDPKAGITREELLASSLAPIGLKTNDIVLLVDEWKSGSNFRNVCERLDSVIPEGVLFFPVALLTDVAPQGAKHETVFAGFCKRHDAYLKSLGLEGADFRRPLPRIAAGGEFTQYFFWAENDRMAGYRKMQVHGSFFSSVDGAVQQIANDPGLCAELLRAKWSEFWPEKPFDAAEAFAAFKQVLADYSDIRDALEHCADAMNKGGEIPPDEVEEYGRKVIERIWAVVGDRPAKMAINLANTSLEKTAGLDPADLFHFKGHAPIAGILQGRADLWHQITLEVVAGRRDAIARDRP